MKQRRLPDGPEIIPSAFLSRVPDVIAARVQTMIDGIDAHAEHGLEADAQKENLMDRLKLIHLPTRKHFQGALLPGRVQIPEVKIDKETNRYYLVAGGVPGREESHEQLRPVEDEQEIIARQVFTEKTTADDLVVAYTEVSSSEFKDAADKAAGLSQAAQQGLAMFFEIPPTHLTGLVLGLPSLSSQELEETARYALHEKGHI